MKRHAHMRRHLYEYLREELPEGERQAMREHLRSCPQCAASLEALRRTTSALDQSRQLPADSLPEAYWRAFPDRVITAVRRQERPAPPVRALVDRAVPFWLFHRRETVALAGVLVIALCAVLLWPRSEQPGVTNVPVPATAQVTMEQTNERMNHYLRRSKALLVGLTNMRVPAGQPLDLDAEQHISRELVSEGRYLKRQQIDLQSARLISDLDKILIGVANVAPDRNFTEVNIIRDGISRENLLFKVRKAEARSERPGIVSVSEKR